MSHLRMSGLASDRTVALVKHTKLAACHRRRGLTWRTSQRSSGGKGLRMRVDWIFRARSEIQTPNVGKRSDAARANSYGVRNGAFSGEFPGKSTVMDGASKPTAFANGSCIGNNSANNGYNPANHFGVDAIPKTFGREKSVRGWMHNENIFFETAAAQNVAAVALHEHIERLLPERTRTWWPGTLEAAVDYDEQSMAQI